MSYDLIYLLHRSQLIIFDGFCVTKPPCEFSNWGDFKRSSFCIENAYVKVVCRFLFSCMIMHFVVFYTCFRLFTCADEGCVPVLYYMYSSTYTRIYMSLEGFLCFCYGFFLYFIIITFCLLIYFYLILHLCYIFGGVATKIFLFHKYLKCSLACFSFLKVNLERLFITFLSNNRYLTVF